MLLLSLVFPALAVDADTFELSGSMFDGQGALQVTSPEIGWTGSAYGALAIVYAHKPLVRTTTLSDGTLQEDVLVGSSFATHLAGGYNILGQVRLDLDIPIYPYVGGADNPASGAAIGDIRLQGVVPLIEGEDAPLGVAIIPLITLPSGNTETFTGSAGVGGGLTVAAGLRPVEALALVANAGIYGTPKDALGGTLAFGSGLALGLGGNYAISDAVKLGAELDALLTLAGGLGPYNKNPVELHVYGAFGDHDGLAATLGLGTGLVSGVGAPALRVIGGLTWRHAGVPPIQDIDKDGIQDPSDKCPEVPEDSDAFEDDDGCPELDNDLDGVLDVSDKCVFEAEDKDNYADDDGCPDPDNDLDGIADRDDFCPNVSGPAETFGCPDRDRDTLADDKDQCPTEAGPKSTRGCPDRDADDVADNRDKCPDKPKDAREDPSRSDGCPGKKVIVTGTKIEILDVIYFDTGKTTIKPVSFPLLDQIATTFNANTDILGVEVGGHTDSDGNDDANLKLSYGRAQSVVKYLVEKGKVDAARLTPMGYGESKPIAPNTNATGKATNRRVEFVITKLAPPKAE